MQKELSEVLSQDEQKFVRWVTLNPGVRVPDGFKDRVDNSYFGINPKYYLKPERMGLVRCTGSFTWETTKKVKIIIEI